MNYDTKLCRACGKELPLYKFHVKLDAEKGRNNRCKDCRRAMGGHTKRMPQVPTQQTEITMDVLIQDVFAMQRRQPSNIKLREAVAKLRDNPGCYEQDEYIADLLYLMWENRMRNLMDFDELNERTPTENKSAREKYHRVNGSLESLLDFEYF